jgi:hypothetical protein
VRYIILRNIDFSFAHVDKGKEEQHIIYFLLTRSLQIRFDAQNLGVGTYILRALNTEDRKWYY